MFDRLFPRQIDNTFPGPWPALWLFVPIMLLELVIGGNSIVNTRFVVAFVDAIPIDRYGGGGAQTVVALFALLGLSRLSIALLGVVALIRYRAMIPMMYLLFLGLHLGGRAIGWAHPIVTSGSSGAPAGPGVVTVILALLVIGFALSLFGSGSSRRAPRGTASR